MTTVRGNGVEKLMDNVKLECLDKIKGCGHGCKLEVSDIDPVEKGAVVKLACLIPFPPIEGYVNMKDWKVI